MAATLLPKRRNARATPKQMEDFLDIFREGQFRIFAREALRLRGRIREKGDDSAQAAAKLVAIERSDNWASELGTLLNQARDEVQTGYVDRIEDDETDASKDDVKAVVDLHGADAVAAALVEFADDKGKIGRDFRITGAGFQRRKKKQRS